MLKVYRITKRIFTRFSRNPRLLKCYDCAEKFSVGSLVVSITYSNSCKLRCSNCAARYGIVPKEERLASFTEQMIKKTGSALVLQEGKLGIGYAQPRAIT
jgi:hypothetical protein